MRRVRRARLRARVRARRPVARVETHVARRRARGARRAALDGARARALDPHGRARGAQPRAAHVRRGHAGADVRRRGAGRLPDAHHRHAQDDAGPARARALRGARRAAAHNHRDDLGAAVLIKDNHVAACGGVRPAIERARARGAAHLPDRVRGGHARAARRGARGGRGHRAARQHGHRDGRRGRAPRDGGGARSSRRRAASRSRASPSSRAPGSTPSASARSRTRRRPPTSGSTSSRRRTCACIAGPRARRRRDRARAAARSARRCTCSARPRRRTTRRSARPRTARRTARRGWPSSRRRGAAGRGARGCRRAGRTCSSRCSCASRARRRACRRSRSSPGSPCATPCSARSARASTNDQVAERRARRRKKIAGRPGRVACSRGRSVEAVVVGIGINVHTREFPEELADRATSLALVAAGPRSIARRSSPTCSHALDRDVELVASRAASAWSTARLAAADALRGERVRATTGEGIARGSTSTGGCSSARRRRRAPPMERRRGPPRKWPTVIRVPRIAVDTFALPWWELRLLRSPRTLRVRASPGIASRSRASHDGDVPKGARVKWRPPFELRPPAAFKSGRAHGALRIFVEAIFVLYRKRARAHGLAGTECGAVTFVQRFGSSLNLNVHFHVVVLRWRLRTRRGDPILGSGRGGGHFNRDYAGRCGWPRRFVATGSLIPSLTLLPRRVGLTSPMRRARRRQCRSFGVHTCRAAPDRRTNTRRCTTC